MNLRMCVLTLSATALAACSSAPTREAPPASATVQSPAPAAPTEVASAGKVSPYAPAQEDPSKRGDYVAGGLYAPGVKDSVPDYVPNVDAIPEPEVRNEPRSRHGNRSYAVLGKRYHVRDTAEGYVEQGRASFYGNKFHGRRTSNQEVYDMYAFTAAHKSLPLPSYVRVTNLDNGRSVVVRVNDRGPFHEGRIIDLSYAAAVKLDFIRQGTARVEVRALMPGEEGTPGTRMASARPAAKPAEQHPPLVPDTAVPASEFDRWMQQQGVRVATGRPAEGTAPATTVAAVAPMPTAPAAPLGAVLLQLGAFGSRENAERAHRQLVDAGFGEARIDEGTANGQPVWRVRLGPVPGERVEEITARASALGLGTPKIVRD